MGDVRFLAPYQRVRDAADAPATLAAMNDEDVVAALAGASMAGDPYLANVLATEAQNRARGKDVIVRTAGEGLLVVDREGIIRSMNPAAEALLGRVESEVRCKLVHDTMHLEMPWSECPVRRVVLERGEVLRGYETRFTRKDGSTFPTLVTASPILREGEVQGAVLVFRDVTESHEARLRLEESEQRYASLFLHNPDAVYSFDVSGKFLTANPMLFRLSGYTREELLQNHFQPLVAPEDRERVRELFLAAAAGRPQSYEATLLRKDGGRTPVLVTNVPIVVEGRVVGVYGIAKELTERKRAEESLRYHTSLMEATFESSPDAILVVDGDGRMVAWNRRFAELWAFPPDVLDSRSDEAAMRHARKAVVDPEGFERAIRDSYAPQQPAIHDEVRLLDGRVIERHGAPVRGPEGRRYGWVWTFRDVTRRRRREEALRESEERNRVLVETVKDYALYMLDPSGAVRSWNAGAERLLGHRVDEAPGLHVSAFQPPEERHASHEALRAAAETGRHVAEGWRVRKDGSRFWAHATLTAVRDAEGRLRGFVKVVRDLTERKRFEDALRESDARHRWLYDNVPAMYFTLGFDGTLLSANRYGAEYLGYAPEDLEGRPVTMLAHPEDRDRVRLALSDFVASGREVLTLEFRKLTRDGSVIWARDIIRRVRDPSGREVLLNVCEDVSERRRREAALSRAWDAERDAPPAEPSR